ncbi:long-chain fatty acid--CoA ligase [Pokkaliibacter plantistimulans]|uniref:Long-chain fatty acid--CoA ligase n=1 Tax=Pokkaliibacter plantistimulans TaxID=1635171 RepID=A0ABX5LYG7_9GAMM|nr:fatty acid--CoA ligase [Pokkaliibacter plantistimulans]PXF31714.1 long-chain fatty acid--CoA ligase [Pokkaliibacter plantistimulans]
MGVKLIPPAQAAQHFPLLIKQLFLSAGRYQPDNQIVYRDQQSFSYRQFRLRVQQLAAVLRAAGVKEGDTVAVMDWDSHRYLECYFAVPMLGAVLHHVNIRLSPEQIHYTMAHAEDRFVLVHDDFIPIAQALLPRLPMVQACIRLSDSGDYQGDVAFIGEYEQLLAAAEPLTEFPDFSEDAIATTFYTTGTTGNPKGVFFSHRQLVLHTLNMVGTLGAYNGIDLLRSESVYMPITPMFHVHAWGTPYAATVLNCKQIYPGRYEPNMLVDLVVRHQVTVSHCVPTILQMLLSCERCKDIDFKGWKVLIGGSALPRGLARAAMERGIDISSAYGMSETCPLLTVTHLTKEQRELPLEQQLDYRILTGKPVNLVDLQIASPIGDLLEHDGEQLGEIVVHCPWLTQGYYKEESKSEELWANGWLHTGDVASIHADGFIEIKDRLKDVIKTGGEWLSSLELENFISQHTGVAAVAVVGVADSKWGERPLALVVKSDDTLDDAALRSHLQTFVAQGKLSKWGIPDHFEFVADIPKTSVGKINKKQIRELFGH